MAFNPTTENLWLEVKAAIEETCKHSEPAQDLIRRVTGRFYHSDNQTLEADPENFGYAFLSNMLPTLGVRSPGVKVDAARVIGHQTVSQAMTDGLDSWIKDEDFGEVVTPVRVDFCWLRGVTLHYLDEDTRFSRGTVTPKVKRIDPRRFFIDALADDTLTDEFRGHWYWADLDDLLADADVNPEAVEKLTPAGDDGGTTSTGKTTFRKPSGDALGRRRVKCYSVWIRKRNTIRVLVESNEVVELYPERPYYGPPTGPYTLYDAYPMPGQTWPLSPMVAVEDQVRDLNIHARAMGRAAARRRSIGLVEANNPDLGQKLADAEDGEILPAKGITGQHVVVEVGGATDTQYQHTEYLRLRLDRISGLTATVQGSVGQADTATEAKIADDALSNRTRYLRYRVQHADEESLWRVGWYLFHTEGIVIPVNRRDPYSGELLEGLFFGGPSPTDAGASWDDFNLTVKLRDENPVADQQRFIAYYQLFMDIAQRAPMMPWVRWMAVARDMDIAFDMEGKSDEWMIPEFLGAYGQPPQMPPSAVIGQRPVGRQPGAAARAGGNTPMQPFGQAGASGGRDTIGAIGMNRQGQTTGPSQFGIASPAA